VWKDWHLTEAPTTGALLILRVDTAPADRGPDLVRDDGLAIRGKTDLKNISFVIPQVTKGSLPTIISNNTQVPFKVPEPVAGSLSAVMVAPIQDFYLASKAVITAAVLNVESMIMC